jgi:hypothetical protein
VDLPAEVTSHLGSVRRLHRSGHVRRQQ